MRFTVIVDGVEVGTTGSLGPAESEVLDLVALGATFDVDRSTGVILRATGVDGGCNRGSIRSWSASVSLDGLLATTEEVEVRPVSD